VTSSTNDRPSHITVLRLAEEGNAIAAHVAMIAIYIRRMDVPLARQRQLAGNVRDAILLALKEMADE
jgi:hypothetical protein